MSTKNQDPNLLTLDKLAIEFAEHAAALPVLQAQEQELRKMFSRCSPTDREELIRKARNLAYRSSVKSELVLKVRSSCQNGLSFLQAMFKLDSVEGEGGIRQRR